MTITPLFPMLLIFLISLILVLHPTTVSTQPSFQRGVNLTNWFQASNARQIAFSTYTKQDFEHIKSLGCDVIRLPINLHAMTLGGPDYTLDPRFLLYLDEAVNWAEALDLHLILDNHSFDPAVDTDPAIGLLLEKVWTQMATHYAQRSPRIFYEVLNEPHGITDAAWGDIQGKIIQAIRKVDTTHTIIVGPANWNNYHNLDQMPYYADTNLLYTFHFYDPFLFTHQGATWSGAGIASLANLPFPYQATRMPGLPAAAKGTWIEGAYTQYPVEGTVSKIRAQIDLAVKFRDTRNVRIFCGEFGVYIPNSPAADRVFWYEQVVQYLQQHRIPWTSWDYHGGFGLFNADGQDLFAHDLNLPLLRAMGFTIPPQSPYIPRPDSIGFPIYLDFVQSGLVESSYGDGLLDYFSEAAPAVGKYCLQWENPKQYAIIGFDFRPNRDLTTLRREGYSLQFLVRTNQPATQFELRFLDTKTTAPGDRPWRIRVPIPSQQVPGDNQWHLLTIPLTDFKESGAWDNGWYPPEDKFDWSKIDRFEIVAEEKALPNTTLWFDQIQITKPALTQIQEANFLEIQIFPNPVREQLQVFIPEAGNFQLQVIDVNGSIVYQETINTQAQINTATYPTGTYYLLLKQAGQIRATKPFQKQ